MPIKIAGLSFAYDAKPVLYCGNAVFEEGLVHLVLGPTGSGKSTLALMIAGLIKPDAGSIGVDGSDPAGRGFDRSVVQLAFQFPETQIFEESVGKEIVYGLGNFGLDQTASIRRCLWALEMVGLDDDLLDRAPGSLSFGERRKVALASVIAIKPRYLILDEPLAGLDWSGRRSLVAAINDLKEEGLTTIILTHEADLLADTGDTVSVISETALTGPVSVEAFLSSSALESRHMWPDHVALVGELGSRGIEVQGSLRSVGEILREVLKALGLDASSSSGP